MTFGVCWRFSICVALLTILIPGAAQSLYLFNEKLLF